MDSFFQDRSRSGSTDLCINLYPEHTDGPKGPELGTLFGSPGTLLLKTIGNGPIRGGFSAKNGFLYLVSGSQLYACDTAYNATLLGSIGSTTGPVSIVESPTQILVVDGTGGWVWNFVTSTFSKVLPNASTSDTNPVVAVYQDGFGLVNSTDNQIYQSNYNDLTAWATATGSGSLANNAFVQGNPQPVVTMFDLKEEVWIFKQKSAEVWINQGNPGFAFVQLQGVSLPFGCAAAASVARLGDGLAWLGSDEQGDGVVYLSVGYKAKPITTFALANAFQNYAVISDAQAYSYQANGHYFYVLTFPTQGVTWVYDLITGRWHQRAYFSNGNYGRELANCYMFFNGTSIVGDYTNGNIYALSEATYTDNGNLRKWLRSWRALPSAIQQSPPMSFDWLQILMETGITVSVTGNPQVMLRFSNDGGYTWFGPFLMSAGKIGQTAWRVIQNRLGSTSIGAGLDRIWEISSTDPISVKILGAEFEGGP